MKNTILLAFAFSTLAVASAEAACRIPGNFRFYPDQNDRVTYSPVTDAAGCRHNYQAGGKLAYTSASIVSNPRNGTLRQLGAFTFGYVPKAGFKGQDTYAIKICGTSAAGSGCSTLTYQATVE